VHQPYCDPESWFCFDTGPWPALYCRDSKWQSSLARQFPRLSRWPALAQASLAHRKPAPARRFSPQVANALGRLAVLGSSAGVAAAVRAKATVHDTTCCRRTANDKSNRPKEAAKHCLLTCAHVGCSKRPQQDARAIPSDAAVPPPAGELGRGMTPSKEAFVVCTDKKVDEVCSMTHADHEMKGKCASPAADAKDQRLSCRPEVGPGPRAHEPLPSR